MTTTTTIKYITLVLALSSSLAHGLGRTIHYSELTGRFFGTIITVSECGNHLTDHMSQYRLIHSYIYGGDMLFIDEISLKDGTAEVVRGYSFTELNNDHAELTLEEVTCELNTNNQLLLSGSVNGSGHSDTEKYDFLITLDINSGKYRYSKVN